MPNIGAPELILIILVALIVFGPRKLPELAKSLGSGLREFRKVTSGVTEEFKTTIDAPATPAMAVATVTPAPVTPVPVPATAVAVPDPVQRSV